MVHICVWVFLCEAHSLISQWFLQIILKAGEYLFIYFLPEFEETQVAHASG